MFGIRNRKLGGWLLAGGVLTTCIVGACAEKKGAVMLAINTDMRAPKDVNAVSITISTNGAIKESFIGRVTPQGEVLLPATLAIVQPDDPNALIRVRVMAFQDRRPRVMRDIRTTVPTGGRTALLRIPLNFVNDGMVVGSSIPAGVLPPNADPNGTQTPPGGTSSGGPNGGTSGSSGSGGAGTADAGSSAGSSGDDGSMFGSTAGDYDFLAAFQPPCPPPADGHLENVTVIDGECADNYVDPATLPDFDPGQIGDSTDVGTCFDLAKCFAGAVGIGDMTATGDDAGAAAGKDSGTVGGDFPDSAAPLPTDAGAKNLPIPKDLRPTAVTLDRATCALQLNGASPDRLNLAIVTPDTGECVRPGECYVPIDRGAGGWQEQNGVVQLPTFVCKLLNSKSLRLATSSDVCAAKEEKNPICTPKKGEVVGGGTGGDASVNPGPVFGIPEDFPTTLAMQGPLLYFATAARVGTINLSDPAAKGTAVNGVPVAHLPWRFGGGQAGLALALANGTTTGYMVASDAVSPVTIAPSTVDVAPIEGGLIWAVSGSGGGLFHSPPSPASRLDVAFNDVTALSAASPSMGVVAVGDAQGNVRLCQSTGACGNPGLATGRVDALILNPAAGSGAGFALTPTGIFTATVTDPAPPTTITVTLLRAAPATGIQEATGYYAHAGALASPACLVHSTTAGLEYTLTMAQDGTPASGVLVPAQAGKPILGVAVGPDPRGGLAAYYTVYAAKDPNGALTGGGIYRVPLPAECGGGVPMPPPPQDAGGGGGMGCGPGNCATGCCTTSNVCLDFLKGQQSSTACGNSGGKCVNCNADGGAVTCAPMPPTGGICGG